MMSDLPEDLMEEILSRVPVTSLRRLRSTCKQWYHQALFKDPRFIKKYFDKTARQYHALMQIDNRVCSMSSVLDRITRMIHLAVDGHHLADPHGNEPVSLSRTFHCDGILLCIPFMKNMIAVWNPFRGQTRWIQVQYHHNAAYAIGYDNKELFRSYKILRFRRIYGELASWGALAREGKVKLEIYEFSSNSWRNLDAITPDQAYLKSYDGGVSLNGNTYWVSYNQKGDNKHYSLLSFDFSTERFQCLCAPFHHEPYLADDTMALSVVREEHLSLFYQSRKTRKVEIWMTDEIETTFVSWTKFLTVDLESYCFLKNDMSFFIIDEEKKVVVCCDEKGNWSFRMVWINLGEEDYRASPHISVRRGMQTWCFPCRYPRLFGYVPKN